MYSNPKLFNSNLFQMFKQNSPIQFKFAPLLFIGGIVLFNFGSALATRLFDTLGVIGTVHFQFVIAAVILLAFTRPNFRKLDRSSTIYLLLYGLTLCSIEVFFFQAIARLPIGVVVSICFCGPLFLSLIKSSSLKDYFWLSLACIGLILLLPIESLTGNIDFLGYLFAICAAAGIALYIIVSKKLSEQLPGLQGLAGGMGISAVVTLPFAMDTYQMSTFNPEIISLALVVALFGIVLPYTLEYIAMAKLKTKTIGILSSSEPIIAGVIGLVVLGEFIGVVELVAFALITVASIGSIEVEDVEESIDEATIEIGTVIQKQVHRPQYPVLVSTS